MTPIVALIFLALFGAIGLFVSFALRSAGPSDGPVVAFAEFYDIPLTNGNVEILRRTLRRSRVFRILGALFALAALFAAVAIELVGAPGIWRILSAIAVGFALGSVVDELSRRPMIDESAPTEASLDSRTVRTYVERRVLGAMVLTVVAAVGQIAVAWSLIPRSGWFMYAPGDDTPIGFGSPLSLRQIVVWAALGASAVVLSLIALRRIVRAPAPVQHRRPDLAAAAHGVRTAGVLSVVGAILVVSGALTATVANANVLSDGNRSEVIRWFDNLSLYGGAFALWFGLNLSIRALPRPSRRTARRDAVDRVTDPT